VSDYGYLRQEIGRLKDENEVLREEVFSLRQYIESIQTLMTAIDELDPKAKIRPLMDRMLRNAISVTDARDGSLLVLDEDTNELVFVLSHGEVDTKDILGRRIPKGKGIAGWVVANRKPTIANNTQSDVRFYVGIDDALGYTTNSILAAPIMTSDRVLGVIELLNKQDGKPFNDTDQNLLTILCRFAGEIVHRMLREETEAI